MILTVAEQLDRALAGASAIAVPPALGDLSLSDAYDVQDQLVALRVAAGARQSGWKLGITSPVKQQVMGITHPLFGRTFVEGERPSGQAVEHAGFIAPRTEPELAFALASTIDASMDADALLAAIAFIAPALEITDSRYRGGNRTAVELVADNTSSSAYAIGPWVRPRDAGRFSALTTELLCNGRVVATGSTGDVLGDPLNALKALAVHLAWRGLRAEPGEIVLSGAITDAIPVSAGDVVEARIAGLGSASVTFR